MSEEIKECLSPGKALIYLYFLQGSICHLNHSYFYDIHQGQVYVRVCLCGVQQAMTRGYWYLYLTTGANQT